MLSVNLDYRKKNLLILYNLNIEINLKKNKLSKYNYYFLILKL